MRAFYALFLTVGLSWGAFAQMGVPPSTNPVSDYVAFRLFFAAVAENSSPASAETARQDARLKPIQLTDVDKAVLVKALSGFKNNLANGQQAPQPPSLNAIIQSALADLQVQMSKDGFQRLYAHVRLQKQYMREVPFPASMTSHASMASHDSSMPAHH